MAQSRRANVLSALLSQHVFTSNVPQREKAAECAAQPLTASLFIWQMSTAAIYIGSSIFVHGRNPHFCTLHGWGNI